MTRTALAFCALAALGTLGCSPAFARGAAQNNMNSPGYQRALEESRKQRALATQPTIAPVKRSQRKSRQPR